MPPSYLSVVSGRQPVPKFTKDGFLVKSAAHVSTRRPEGFTSPFRISPSAVMPFEPVKPIHTAALILSAKAA